MILFVFGISIAVNIFFFIFAAKFKTDKVTDLSYGLSFIAVILATLLVSGNFTLVNIVVSSMICLWAIRLAGFLFMRINKMKRDKRFDGIRENFWSFLKFWVLQALSVGIIILPAVLIIPKNENSLTVLSFIGLGLWIFGLVLEAVADQQKFNFKNKPENEGRFITTGVWKYSRHPNYLGEIMCWWGVFIFCISFLSGVELLSTISPLYITLLLLFVTGIPTIENKYRDNDEYKRYAEKTGVLLPKIL